MREGAWVGRAPAGPGNGRHVEVGGCPVMMCSEMTFICQAMWMLDRRARELPVVRRASVMAGRRAGEGRSFREAAGPHA